MLTAHTSAAPVRTGRSMCLMVRPHSWTRRRTAVLTARVNRFSTLVSSRTGCWAPRGRGTRFSQQRLTALRRKPLLCGWTGQVASTGQRRYSDLAIETALTLRLLYHLPLRQAEGFLHALFGMMRLDLSAPDSTRRSPGAASI